MTTITANHALLSKISPELNDLTRALAAVLGRVRQPELAKVFVRGLDLTDPTMPDTIAQVAVHLDVIDAGIEITRAVHALADTYRAAQADNLDAARAAVHHGLEALRGWLSANVTLVWPRGSTASVGHLPQLAHSLAWGARIGAPVPKEIYEARGSRMYGLPWSRDTHEDGRKFVTINVGGLSISAPYPTDLGA